MNCGEFQKLLDTHLDGELTGSLRLEFDAHRLRCRRCQQTVAMMEAVGHVVATDNHTPTLSNSFTDGVMERIEQREPLGRRLRATRIAVVTGMMLQAAAVLLFTTILPSESMDREPGPLAITSDPAGGVPLIGRMDIDLRDFYTVLIHDKLRGAGVNVATDLEHLSYWPRNLTVRDDYARASVSLARGATGIISVFLQAEVEESEPSPAAPDEHQL